MIRLLFDARTFESSFSGIALTTLRLYNALNANYTNEISFNGMYREKLYQELPSYIKTSKAFFPIKKYSAFNIRHAKHVSKSDYIHFPLNGEIPFGIIPGKKISTIHDVLPLEIPGYFRNSEDEMKYKKKMQSSISRTNLIFTPSQYSKNRILEEFKVDVSVVVQPWGGIHTEEKKCHEQAKVTPQNKPYFLYAGGYDERKGIKDLLRGLLVLREKLNEDFYVVFVGKQWTLNNETESLLAECRNKKLVVELGYVSEQELYELYRGAQALCFLSKYEGFGLTPLEAMSLGCPVITTKYTSIPEVCGDAALYVEPDNPEEVALAMEQMFDNGKREKHINKGHKQSASFSWKHSADIFIKHVKDL